jgi:hypothetical protein
MKKIINSVLLLMLLVPNAYADPNTTAQFLMDDPVSLLDFGVYKLENEIKVHRKALVIKRQPPHTVFVDYNWEENKIEIKLAYGDVGNPPIAEIKREIITILGTLKKILGVSPAGKAYHKDGFSSVPEYFSHKGYISKNKPKNVEKEIDQLVEFKVVYYVQNYSRYFECKNSLISDSAKELTCSNYIQ